MSTVPRLLFVNSTDVSTNMDADIIISSGAAVSRSSVDNSLTYNVDAIPGIYDLWAGYGFAETITYQVIDGGFSTNSADINFDVSVSSHSVPDSFTVTEGDVRVFQPGELSGNDQQISMAPWMELNTAAVTGQDVIDGIWRNLGTVGRGWDYSISRGDLVNVSSGFGGIGRAWRDIIASGYSLEETGNNISGNDLTLEIWFKPDFADKGDVVLYEVGGSTYGTYVVYESDNNFIRVSVDCNYTSDPANLLEARIEGVRWDEFNQLIVVYDRDNPGSTDSLTLYLNNDPSAAFSAALSACHTNTLGGVNDFAGGDDAGIGHVESSTAHAFTEDNYYNGDIAIINVFSRALTISEMEQRYEQVKRGIISVSPATTALGAAVSLNPDGSVSYDASSLSTNILEGESAEDVFSYTLSDGAGGTTTTNVTVTVEGLASVRTVPDTIVITAGDAVTDYDPLTNDVGLAGAQVGVSSVVYNYLNDYGTGSVSGENADFRNADGYGARFLWNAPENWVDGSPELSDLSTGTMGETNLYKSLVWDITTSSWMVNNSGSAGDGFPGNHIDFDALGPHAGAGAGEDDNNGNTNYVSRGPVFAYTVGNSGYYQITNSWFKKTNSTGDAMVLKVFVDEALYLTLTNAPLDTNTFDIDLGYLGVGQDIYICVDSSLTESYDNAEWDFNIIFSSIHGLIGNVWENTVVTGDGSTFSFDTGHAYDNLGVGQVVYDTFNYFVSKDGTTWVETVTVEIHGTNDAPAGVSDMIEANEDDVSYGSLVANDLDIDIGDQSTLGIASVEGGAQSLGTQFETPLGALLTVYANGTYSYDPDGQFEAMLPGEFVSESFTYLVQDRYGLSAPSSTTFTVQVEGRNDGVLATANAYQVKADRTVSGNLITDDTGDGVDSSVDLNDELSVFSVDTSSLKGSVSVAAGQLIAKRGRITNLDENKQTITYGSAGLFNNPVVFANPMTYLGTEVGSVRISNVDPVNSTFDICITEQPEDGFYSDEDGAAHNDEEVSWIVFEAGQYELVDGTLLEVGKVETEAVRQKSSFPDSWETVTFATDFTNKPIVINQLQTYDYTNDLFETRMDGTGSYESSSGVTADQFKVAMEDYEYDQENRVLASHPETIGWIAIEQNTGYWSGNQWEASVTTDSLALTEKTFAFANTYSSVPTFIGCVATYSGGDPCNLRLVDISGSEFTILLVEDTTADNETSHNNEQATYLTVGGTGDLYAYPQGKVAGEFTFDPAGEFDPVHNGPEDTTFTYVLTDLYGSMSTNTVTITVVSPYDATLIIIK